MVCATNLLRSSRQGSSQGLGQVEFQYDTASDRYVVFAFCVLIRCVYVKYVDL